MRQAVWRGTESCLPMPAAPFQDNGETNIQRDLKKKTITNIYT